MHPQSWSSALWTSPGPNDRWRSSAVAIRATCPQPRGCSLHTFSNALLQAPGAAGPLPRDPLVLARHRAKRKSARGSIYCVSRRKLKMVEPLGVGLSLTMGKQSHWAHVGRAHAKHRRSCYSALGWFSTRRLLWVLAV